MNGLFDYGNSKSLGNRFRIKRIEPLLSMIEETCHQYGFVNIVDMGGTRGYWRIVSNDVLERFNVTITLVNLPGNNKPEDEERFRYVEGDCCNLAQYEDNAFHIAHSNSVVEHVGDWESMSAFSHEVSRLAPSYFVQTPNFWFPIEPHSMTPVFHWLPRQTRVYMILKLNIGNWRKCSSVDEAVRTIDSAQLLNKRMFRALFPDAMHFSEKVLFLSKSLLAIRKRDM